MSTFETDEHLHAEHRYTAVGGVVGVLTFVTRELFVLFDGFTIPPQATEQWVDAGREVFQDARSFAPHSGYVRVRLENGCA